MITPAQYWKGRDVAFAPECTPEIRANAAAFLPKFNGCIADYEAATGDRVLGCNSGWRPEVINRAEGGALHSWHLFAKAGDASDRGEGFDNWLSTPAGEASMIRWGLWREAPHATPNWTHLQDEPPANWREGMPRTFNP